jgi:hypothetical protein
MDSAACCWFKSSVVSAVAIVLQVTAYAEVSIRELIKWTKHMLLGLQHTNQQQHAPDSTNTSATAADDRSVDQDAASPMVVPEQLLSDTAWAVYAARFRTPAARAVVTQLVSDRKWPAPHLSSTSGSTDSSSSSSSGSSSLHVSVTDNSRTVQLGSTATLHWQQRKHFDALDAAALQQLPEEVVQAAAAAHAAVVRVASQAHFVLSHGIYQVQQSWLQHWLQQLGPEIDLQQAGWVGLFLYCSRMRHAGARSAIAAAIASQFDLQQQAAVDYAAALSSAEQAQLPPELAGLQLQQPDPAKPFVLTTRVLRAWQVAGRSLMASEPLLVVGRDGSGKSECLRALSWLLGEQLQQFNLTPGGW